MCPMFLFSFHLTAGLDNNGCPTDCLGQPMMGWDKYKIRKWLLASALICTNSNLSALDTDPTWPSKIQLNIHCLKIINNNSRLKTANHIYFQRIRTVVIGL